MAAENSLSLGEAASNFLSRLVPADRESSQPEVNRFVRWFGRERNISALVAPEIANYAERLSLSDTDYAKKLDFIRAFLTFTKKAGWSKTNLAIHLKAKRVKSSQLASGKLGMRETITLTKQGYDGMKAELEELKERRIEVTDEIRRAAADKDFRENAPLHAAREQKGYIEGRIKELEETLKSAVLVVEEQKSTLKAGIGDSVILNDEKSGRELLYMIVHPREVNATKGKISSESPIGRAIVGQREGKVVEVVAPAGKLRYKITQIKR